MKELLIFFLKSLKFRGKRKKPEEITVQNRKCCSGRRKKPQNLEKDHEEFLTISSTFPQDGSLDLPRFFW